MTVHRAGRSGVVRLIAAGILAIPLVSVSGPAGAAPAPGAPTITSVEPNSTFAKVTWTAPALGGGGPVTTYVATATATNGSQPTQSCTTTGALSCTIQGLAQLTSYSFTVVAGNPAPGPPSAPVVQSTSFTLHPLPTSFPDATKPSVTEIVPGTGPKKGGTRITLTGGNFTGATRVTFGGVKGTHLAVLSDARLRVTSPKGPKGTVNVVVKGPKGSSAAVPYVYK